MEFKRLQQVTLLVIGVALAAALLGAYCRTFLLQP